MQTVIHYGLHFILPALVAYVFFKKSWKKVYLILLATMLVDVDHILAEPVFQANRCSIQYHFLHTYYAMIAYALLLFFKKPYRIIGIGLLLHMATDVIDCLFMYNNCPSCYAEAPARELIQALHNFLPN